MLEPRSTGPVCKVAFDDMAMGKVIEDASIPGRLDIDNELASVEVNTRALPWWDWEATVRPNVDAIRAVLMT